MTTQSRKEEQRIWQALPQESRKAIIQRKQNLTVVDGVTYDAEGNNVTHLFDIVPVVQRQADTDYRARALVAMNDLEEHFTENGGFVFAFFKQARTIVERFPSLSQADTARLLFIGTFVAWGNGRLQFGNNGNAITRKRLQELCGMSRNKFATFFKRLESEGILREDAATKDLFMNPTVFHRGEIKTFAQDVAGLEHTRIFRSTVRRLYEEFDGKRLTQLGLLYTVLPFINVQTNTIAYNPDERDIERVQPMTLRHLAMALGYENPQKLKTAMNAVKVDGRPAFLFYEDADNRREKRTIVNPKVVFGGNTEGLAHINLMFKQAPQEGG